LITWHSTLSAFGFLLIAAGLVAWLVIWALIVHQGEFLDGEFGPIPYSVREYPAIFGPRSVGDCIEIMPVHDSQRRLAFIFFPALLGIYAGFFISLGFSFRWARRDVCTGAKDANKQLGLELRRLGLTFLFAALAFGIWSGAADLIGYFSTEGMRVQTETLARTTSQAWRIGVVGTCTTAVAAGAVFGLVGLALMATARRVGRQQTATA